MISGKHCGWEHLTETVTSEVLGTFQLPPSDSFMNLDFNTTFINTFTQQIFTEFLLGARP